MASYIPKEQLQAYTRWEADDFNAPAQPPEPQAPQEDLASSAPEPDVQEVSVSHIPLPTAEDVERIHNEAHNEGYEAGYQAGHQEALAAGQAAVQEQIAQLSALCKGLETALTEMDQQMAESLLACGLEVARQITKATIHVKPEALLTIIREALAALPLHHGPVTLLLNPTEADLVREHLGDQFSHAGWHIQEESEIDPGGCMLRAGSSEVDATAPTRWRRTLEAIGVTTEWLDQQP